MGLDRVSGGIGLLGGTFDPIHFGHLRPALDVQQALNLPSIRLIPLKTPPHREPPVASGKQRSAMIAASIRNVPGLQLDTRELTRSGVTYTVETLRELRREYPGTPLFLLIGTDAFNQFPGWHRPDEILELAHLIIMRRPKEQRPRHYKDRVVETPSAMMSEATGRILFQPVTQLDISATRIRRMIREGRSPQFLMPDAALEIVLSSGLYRD